MKPAEVLSTRFPREPAEEETMEVLISDQLTAEHMVEMFAASKVWGTGERGSGRQSLEGQTVSVKICSKSKPATKQSETKEMERVGAPVMMCKMDAEPFDYTKEKLQDVEAEVIIFVSVHFVIKLLGKRNLNLQFHNTW